MSTTLHLAVQYATARPCPDRTQLRRWLRATVDAATTIDEVRLLLRFVDEAEGRALNRSYRNKDYATNVLTFEYGDARHGPVVADIVISAPVVERECWDQQKSPLDHYAHLVVHGCLHALGFDHQKAREAQRMEALETTILGRFRIADPYGN